LHAAIHTVVESQLALGEPVVIDALARLRSEGLTRHEAVHATGMALADQIYDLLKDQPGGRLDANKPYFDRLKQLTAEQWRKSG
jgi:hypothetical protein